MYNLDDAADCEFLVEWGSRVRPRIPATDANGHEIWSLWRIWNKVSRGGVAFYEVQYWETNQGRCDIFVVPATELRNRYPAEVSDWENKCAHKWAQRYPTGRRWPIQRPPSIIRYPTPRSLRVQPAVQATEEDEEVEDVQYRQIVDSEDEDMDDSEEEQVDSAPAGIRRQVPTDNIATIPMRMDGLRRDTPSPLSSMHDPGEPSKVTTKRSLNMTPQKVNVGKKSKTFLLPKLMADAEIEDDIEDDEKLIVTNRSKIVNRPRPQSHVPSRITSTGSHSSNVGPLSKTQLVSHIAALKAAGATVPARKQLKAQSNENKRLLEEYDTLISTPQRKAPDLSVFASPLPKPSLTPIADLYEQVARKKGAQEGESEDEDEDEDEDEVPPQVTKS